MNFKGPDFGKPTVRTSAVGDPQKSLSAAYAAHPFISLMATIAVLAGIYTGLIASPMYVSETRFTIHNQEAASTAGLLAGLVAGTTGVSDITAVQDYIQSRNMLELLDAQFHLRQSYSKFRIDPLHWLRPKASEDEFLKFYNKMVVVKVDNQASILEIDVRTFDQQSAAPIANFILQHTEAFVAGMTQHMRSETMQAAQGELARAQAKVDVARAALANFRGATSSVNPSGTGEAALTGQAALEAQAALIQGDLASALTFNKPDSPVVKQLQARLATTRAQAAQLKAQQGSGATGLSRQVTSYESLVAQRQTAELTLATAQTGYESARAIAEQRDKYVVRVVNPNIPDRPTEPRRIRDFLMIMIFSFVGYSIVSLIIAGIRDHQGV